MTKKIIVTEEEQRQRKLFSAYHKRQFIDPVRWNKSGPSGGFVLWERWLVWKAAVEANKGAS